MVVLNRIYTRTGDDGTTATAATAIGTRIMLRNDAMAVHNTARRGAPMLRDAV